MALSEGSVSHQQGNPGLGQQAPRDAADDELAQAAVTIGAHDDEVSFALLGFREQGLPGACPPLCDGLGPPRDAVPGDRPLRPGQRYVRFLDADDCHLLCSLQEGKPCGQARAASRRPFRPPPHSFDVPGNAPGTTSTGPPTSKVPLPDLKLKAPPSALGCGSTMRSKSRPRRANSTSARPSTRRQAARPLPEGSRQPCWPADPPSGSTLRKGARPPESALGLSRISLMTW